MNKILQFTLISLIITNVAIAQVTVTFQPDTNGIDAQISSLAAQASINYGNNPEFNAGAWTVGGNPVSIRSLIKFDLSSIPPGAIVSSAYLTFYYDSLTSNFGGIHSGANASYLKKITASWQEYTVTWSNQPATTTVNQVSLPASTSGTQDFNNINVTSLVSDMVLNPLTNYGFMFQLQTETPFKGLAFASSDFPVTAKRPKLIISYSACPVLTTINYSGPLIHCLNETDTLFGPTGIPAYSYQWKKNGLVINGATSKDYIISSPGTGIWTYTCDITTNGCTIGSNAVIDTFLSGNQLAPITITTPGNATSIYCSSLVITAPPGYAKYKWLKGTGIVNLSSSNTFTVTLAGVYSCVAYQSPGCDTAISNLLSITGTTVNTTITASPSSLPCAGGTSTLSVSSTPGAYYQWYKYNSPMEAQTSYNFSTPQIGEYSCDITVPGCPTIHSATYFLTGPPEIIYVPPFNSCNGTQLQATPNALFYQWKLNGNNVLFGGNFSSYLANQYGNYTCQITTANCGSGVSNTIQTNFSPSAPAPYLITNPPGALAWPGNKLGHCGNVALVAYPPGLSYTWHTPWGIVSGGQSLVPSVTGIYWCEIAYGCGNSYTGSYQVSVIPGSPVPVSTSPTSCSTVFMFVSQSILNCQWRKNGVNIAGATNSSYTASTSGYYSCLVSNGCASQVSDSLLVTITGPPSSTITPLGPTTFCTGGSLVLKAPVLAGNAYQWYFNSVLVGTDSIYTATSSGTYRVKVANNGCNTSDSLVVTVVSPPSSVITPSGNLTFCSGDSVMLNATTGIGYAYQWLKNGVNISGAISSSYAAKASGSYTVLVTSTCGVVSPPVTVTVSAKPAPGITASGPLTFCNGDSVVLSTPNAAGFTFMWKRNGVAIAGATSFKYTAKTAGTYKVVKTNVYGCSGTSPGKIVVINNPVATITAQGPTSFCLGDSVVLMAPNTTGYSYQWKKFNNNIAGATSVKYTAKTQSTYKVLVTNSGGCTKLSPGVVVTVPCREGEPDNPGTVKLSLFPNPFRGNFTLEVNNIKDGITWDAEIYDITGRLVEIHESSTKSLTTGDQLVPGIYEIVVKTGNEIKRIRAVKGEE